MSDPKPHADPAPPPRKRPRRVRAVVRTAVLMAAGFTAASFARSSPSIQPTPKEPTAAHATESPDHHADHGSEARRIDSAIRSGQYATALDLCRAAPSTAFGTDGRRQKYREGLCLEALGRLPEAATAYSAAADDHDPDVGTWARATLGRVRTTRDDPATARRLLAAVLLKSGDPACGGRRVLDECLHVRARLAVRDLGPQPDPDPFDITAAAWADLDGGLLDYLDWLPEPTPAAHPEPEAGHGAAHPAPKTKVEDPHPGPKADDHPGPAAKADPQPVPKADHHPAPKTDPHPAPKADAHHPAPKPDPHHPPPAKADPHHPPPAKAAAHQAPKAEEGIRVTRDKKAADIQRVSGRMTGRAPAEVLRAIGKAAGLTVRIDPAAAAALATPTTVALADVPLGEVLDALTGPQALGWRIRADTLDVRPDPAPPSPTRATAIDAIRLALRLAPGHPAEVATELGLGNLLLGAGRTREAVGEYHAILDDRRHSPVAMCAAYNLGLVELRRGDIRSARSRFVEVLDRKTQPRWADLATWWVARTHLDAGEFDAAVRPLTTAQAGKAKGVGSAATLALAVVNLLKDDEAGARAVLAGRRLDKSKEHTAVAGWVDAVFRYRAAPSPGRAAVVVAAAHRADDGAAFGPAGMLLAGRLFKELGQWDEMTRVYDAVGPVARGRLAAEMTFAVAERLDAIGLRSAARTRLLAVAAADPDGFGPAADYRLAVFAADAGDADDCIHRARGVITRVGAAGSNPDVGVKGATPERSQVLVVMGRGYEHRRDYRRAAECFAGRVPDE